ncbi:MAG: family 16 glycoside hydrolase, partial [Verrucomicrobiia bacterium]
MKFTHFSIALVLLFMLATPTFAAKKSNVLLEDDFERVESNPEKEEVGNGWGTNSRTRAKGTKQVDLADGAMHITRAAVADHGVSVHHDV